MRSSVEWQFHNFTPLQPDVRRSALDGYQRTGIEGGSTRLFVVCLPAMHRSTNHTEWSLSSFVRSAWMGMENWWNRGTEAPLGRLRQSDAIYAREMTE